MNDFQVSPEIRTSWLWFGPYVFTLYDIHYRTIRYNGNGKIVKDFELFPCLM